LWITVPKSLELPAVFWLLRIVIHRQTRENLAKPDFKEYDAANRILEQHNKTDRFYLSAGEAEKIRLYAINGFKLRIY